MDPEFITRKEHEEFARRMETENNRLADENNRQNKRIDILEGSVRELTALTASVEKLATNVETMVKEQGKQEKRLETLTSFVFPKDKIQTKMYAVIVILTDLLFLHKPRAGVPGLSDFFARGVITVLELIEHKSVKLSGVDLAIFGQNSFFRFHIDDFPDNTGNMLGVKKFQQLTFHYHRELLDDGGVDLIAFHGVVTGALEFIIHLVPGGDAEEIGDIHMGHIRDGDGKGFTGFDIQPCFLPLSDKKDDLVHIADLPPRNIHDIDLFILIVSRYHQYRHGVNSLNNA